MTDFVQSEHSGNSSKVSGCHRNLHEHFMTIATANSAEMKVARDAVVINEKLLRDTCSWNCVVYDLGDFCLAFFVVETFTDVSLTDIIEESTNGQAIHLMLLENDVFFNQPDSSKDSLFHLLLSIARRSSNEVDTLLKVHRQARTKTSNLESIFKDRSGLMVYSMPYTFHGMRGTQMYNPVLIHRWQPCAIEVSPLSFLFFFSHTKHGTSDC
jgi:hypothetical protein